jgi:hypothetical protein
MIQAGRRRGVWRGRTLQSVPGGQPPAGATAVALAEKQGATVPLMIGHRLMGMSALHTGEFAQARVHYDRGVALYDPAEHRPLATRFGQDVRVASQHRQTVGKRRRDKRCSAPANPAVGNTIPPDTLHNADEFPKS